ncbi:hypothetical protein ZHAS_00004077 [Anopheles sinensis]|uniref:Uncharacterized protein n=1 Tax=Anopheles sinensis TaxID=74873 RepID=A0A084VG13_ANOSI|nr:hypothetical protein ZHAS_00004077 [Anopheles sinensis]
MQLIPVDGELKLMPAGGCGSAETPHRNAQPRRMPPCHSPVSVPISNRGPGVRLPPTAPAPSDGLRGYLIAVSYDDGRKRDTASWRAAAAQQRSWRPRSCLSSKQARNVMPVHRQGVGCYFYIPLAPPRGAFFLSGFRFASECFAHLAIVKDRSIVVREKLRW